LSKEILPGPSEPESIPIPKKSKRAGRPKREEILLERTEKTKRRELIKRTVSSE